MAQLGSTKVFGDLTVTGKTTINPTSVSDGLLYSVATVAAAGTTQATATAISKDYNVVSSGTGGVILPVASVGEVMIVFNNTASAINIYPAVGGYIDGLAQNAALSLMAYGSLRLYAYDATHWESTLDMVTSGTKISGVIPNANTTASSTNGASTIITRDANGSFSSNIITANSFAGTLNGTINRTVTTGTNANIIYGIMADNDYYRIMAGGASNGGSLEIATADDGTEPIYVRQYSGAFAAISRTATLLDGSGNTIFPGSLTANSIVKSGGTSSEFLKADGSVDSNTYSVSTHNHNGTYAPVSHIHGNITSDGAIGSTPGLMVKTTTSGVLTTLAAGSSGQFLQYDGTWATPPTPSYSATNGVTLNGTTFEHVDTSSVTNMSLGGANVLSAVNFDTFGHVISLTNRAMTYTDVGAAASSHTHGTYDNSTALTGANVYSNVQVTDGIVTGLTSRALGYGDVGAAASSHSHGNITSDGKIGTVAGNVAVTTTNGVLTALVQGTTSQYLRGDGTWATPPNTTYTAGNGLGLSGTTFSLNTPSTLTASTSNAVTADSHTHAITTSSSGAVSTIIATDAGGNISIGNVTAASLKKSGGTSSQFLKADGSVDSNTYSTTSHNHSGVYQPVDADLTAIAALSGTSGFLKKTAADTWILESILGLITTYSGTLSTSWSGSQAPFSQAVTVTGIASTDEPILDVVMSGTYATDELRNTEWAYIYYAITATDQITFYARQKPTASLPFTAKVI